MNPPPELSRPVAVAAIPQAGLAVSVEADGTECAALARRMAIPAVLALTCRFRLVPGPAGSISATGELRARVVQDCVVSLEPFEAAIAEPFAVRFVPAALLGGEIDPDPEAEDEVGYDDGVIDLGEAAAEQLGLALDPWPRAPGAVLPATAAADDPGPFAALSARKPGR